MSPDDFLDDLAARVMAEGRMLDRFPDEVAGGGRQYGLCARDAALSRTGAFVRDVGENARRRLLLGGNVRPLRDETDARTIVLFVALLFALSGGDDFVEFIQAARNGFELLNTEKKSPRNALERLGVVNRVPGGDFSQQRKLAERAGGKALVHQAVVDVHVRDTVQRDSQTSAEAQATEHARSEEAERAQRERRDAVDEREDVVRLVRTLAREVMRLV